MSRLIRFARFTAVALILFAWHPGQVRAQYIDGTDLFLSPTQVPEAFYNPLVLSAGSSFTFSASEVSGATKLDSIRILPLLAPNPVTDQGQYTAIDLTKITAGNYSSYFAFQPNVDYRATLISGNDSTVTFGAAGSYFVQLTTSNGTSEKRTLIHAEVDDSFLGPNPNKDGSNKAGPERKIANPNTDLVIISNDPKDNGALANAKKHYPNAPTANNIKDVCDAIQKYYKAHGNKKFSVTLIGHGNEGRIDMGNESITNDKSGTMTAADFQTCIDHYISRISFYSCKTFGGAKGDDFYNQMAKSLGQGNAGGWHDSITSTDSYFDANAGAKLGIGSVPEPSAVALLMSCGLAIAGVQIRRSRALSRFLPRSAR